MFCRRLRRLWNTSRNQAFHFLYLLLLLQCTASEPQQRDRRFEAGSIDRSVHRYSGSSTAGRSAKPDFNDHSTRRSAVNSNDEYLSTIVVGPKAERDADSKSQTTGSKDFSLVNPFREKCSNCKSNSSSKAGGGGGNSKKDGIGQIRLFKYLQPDEIPKVSEPEEVTTDRSFIPNSYFSPKPSPSPAPAVVPADERSLSSEPLPKPLPTNMSLPTASERPRRSPYGDYPHRSPLYARPNFPQYPPTSPSGFGEFGNMPEYPEEPTFNHARYKRPPQAGGGAGRRAPPQRRRLPPGRPAKPRPAPRPRPQPMNAPRRPNRPVPIGIPAPPQYKYPKNAANIQDILNHFQNENDPPEPQREPSYRIPPYKHPIPQATNSPDTSGSMSGSMGGDFSKELHDVQTSLLKDIREFARRPSMMSGEEHSPPPTPAPTQSYPKRVEHKREEEDEDPYELKPKPVRDLIRNKPVPLPREREESRERHEPKKSRTREKEDRWRERDREESEEKSRPKPRERERERDHSEEDRPRDRHRDELRERPRPRPKYPTHKYKNVDHGSSSYEDRDERGRYRDRTHSHSPPSTSYHRSPNQNHAVVLKRPYGTYKPPEEDLEPLEMQRKPQYWSSTERDESYRHSRPTLPSRYNKYRSRPEFEPVEDIVEIHTDSPYRVDLSERVAREREERERIARERERKAALHKLYLDYLEAEAVVTTPAPPVSKTPMRMKIHIYPNQKSDIAEMGAEPSQSSYAAASPPRYNYPPSFINPAPPPAPITRGPYYSPGRTGPSSYGPSSTYNSGMGMGSMTGMGMSGSGSGIGGMTGISYGSSSSSGTGTTGTGVGTGIDKNKNLVLHLHVHRRTGLEQMEAQGSQIYTSTVKPLTYKEIFDDHVDTHQQQHEQHEDLNLNHRNHPAMNHHPNHNNHNHNHANHNHQHQPGDPEVDKSVSMELPIQDAKIEDVLHTLLKLRQ